MDYSGCYGSLKKDGRSYLLMKRGLNVVHNNRQTFNRMTWRGENVLWWTKSDFQFTSPPNTSVPGLLFLYRQKPSSLSYFARQCPDFPRFSSANLPFFSPSWRLRENPVWKRLVNNALSASREVNVLSTFVNNLSADITPTPFPVFWMFGAEFLKRISQYTKDEMFPSIVYLGCCAGCYSTGILSNDQCLGQYI